MKKKSMFVLVLAIASLAMTPPWEHCPSCDSHVAYNPCAECLYPAERELAGQRQVNINNDDTALHVRYDALMTQKEIVETAIAAKIYCAQHANAIYFEMTKVEDGLSGAAEWIGYHGDRKTNHAGIISGMDCYLPVEPPFEWMAPGWSYCDAHYTFVGRDGAEIELPAGRGTIKGSTAIYDEAGHNRDFANDLMFAAENALAVAEILSEDCEYCQECGCCPCDCHEVCETCQQWPCVCEMEPPE